MRRWAGVLLRLYVAASCAWLLMPIVIVVILAFSGEGYLHFPPSSLSLQWFARFFGDLQWQRALLSSLIIGALACLVSTATGFFAAYAFLRAEFRGKKLLLSLLLTPIIVPSIITAMRATSPSALSTTPGKPLRGPVRRLQGVPDAQAAVSGTRRRRASSPARPASPAPACNRTSRCPA